MTENAPHSQIPAGWYPSSDPNNPGKLQWWDGTAWSDHVLSDFTGVDPARLSKIDARTRVEHLQQTVHQLETIINQHGLRTAIELEEWRTE